MDCAELYRLFRILENAFPNGTPNGTPNETPSPPGGNSWKPPEKPPGTEKSVHSTASPVYSVFLRVP